MKTNERKMFIVLITSLVILLLDIFVTNILSDFGMLLFLLLILGVIIILFGYSNNRKLYSKDAVLNVIIYCFLYYIILYLSGIFIGFLKSSYNLSIIGIFKNVFLVIILIIVTEWLRYVIISKCNKSNLLIILSTILFTFIDVKLISYAYDLSSLIGILRMGYMSFIPLLAKNIFLTYMCYRFGYVPNYVYRFFMEIPVYILPIVVNIGDYFTTVNGVIFPMLLLYLMYKEFNNNKKKEVRRDDSKNRVSIVFALVLIVLIVSLTSGIFRYFALAVGSDSMADKINKGDVVIVEKIDSEYNLLKEGEVIVYKHNDVMIVHRIVKAFSENGEYYFITKGDNNNTVDSFTISSDMVIGKAILRIPYIGIPTVWLNEKV